MNWIILDMIKEDDRVWKWNKNEFRFIGDKWWNVRNNVGEWSNIIGNWLIDEWFNG